MEDEDCELSVYFLFFFFVGGFLTVLRRSQGRLKEIFFVLRKFGLSLYLIGFSLLVNLIPPFLRRF